MNPRIGKLIRDGATIYYCYINGQYVEHKDEDVLARALKGM